jgi:Protein of unknown function (DUF1499)
VHYTAGTAWFREARVSEGRERGSRLRRVLLGFVGLALVVLIVLGAQVDDWSRDLTTNTAATSSTGDPALRPLRTTVPREELLTAILAEGQDLGWELDDREDDGPRTSLHFVRTSALFRFKDDIWVHVTPQEAGLLIEAEAAARTGKGDLGQNPRTLKDLLARIQRRLAE